MNSNLWLGLNPETDLTTFYERSALYSRLVAEDRLVMPGFDQTDWSGWSKEELDPREERRLRVILDDLDRQHAERHWFYPHPFCPGCREDVWRGPEPGQEASGAQRSLWEAKSGQKRAAASLTRWMILNPGRTPRDTWDGTLPVDQLSGNRREDFVTLEELRAMPAAEMLVDEILPQGSIGYVTGRDGTYKTFLALDLALHVITCKAAWNDRTISWDGFGRVLFIAGEGARSFPKRIDAWLAHHDTELTAFEQSALMIRRGAVDLYGAGEPFQELLQVAREQEPDLIVVDTLNRSAGAAEQNSASDMSVITARLTELKAAAGERCTVLVLAHTDKGDKDARGSSAIEDDADFVLHCKKDDQRLTVTVAKMKDGESGQTIDLKVKPVEDSLVLIATQPEPEWLSDSLAQRIRAVLFKNRSGDHLTSTQVLALVKDDGTEKPASRTAVYAALGELVRSGEVLQAKTGKGASSPARHWLNPDHWPEWAKE